MPVTAAKYPTGNASAWSASAGTISASVGGGTTNLNADDNAVVSFTTVTRSTVASIDSGAVSFSSAEIPAGSTINAVTVETGHFMTSGGTSQQVTPLLGATAGAAVTLTAATAETLHSVAVSRPGGGSWTQADLTGGTLKIRLTGTQPNNTTSRTYSWDYVRVVADYSPPVAFSDAAAGGVPVAGAGLEGVAFAEASPGAVPVAGVSVDEWVLVAGTIFSDSATGALRVKA